LKITLPYSAVLAWTHLVGMNVGDAATTLTMIFTGLIGSGILSVITSGASASSSVSQLQPNVGVMVQFIPSISAFAGLLSIGVIRWCDLYYNVFTKIR
jgi:hypothetical protein